MMFFMMFMLSVKGNRAADVITPYTAAVFTNEGESVTLSCNYSGSVRSLYCTAFRRHISTENYATYRRSACFRG
ncbi:hypothetical protein SRHO_G00020530 [Serrasalmus rhombeus]